MAERLRLLLVEDSPDDAELLTLELRRGGFEPDVRRVETLDQMLAALDEAEFDALITDYSLPNFSGPEAVAAATELRREQVVDLPTIVVSGRIGEDVAVETMRLGAHDYVLKSDLTRLPEALRREITEAGERRARRQAELSLTDNLRRLRETFRQTAECLSAATESRDPYTAGHQRRVAELTVAIAEEIGLGEEQREGLHVAAVLHDIGKIRVPAQLLIKPGKLLDYEWRMIKLHPAESHEILAPVDFPWPVADIAYQHHERLDGSGYPRGLRGDEILLETTIMTVADVVEAMSSHRPYRPALGIEAALAEIVQHRGDLYAPGPVDACVGIMTRRKFRFTDESLTPPT